MHHRKISRACAGCSRTDAVRPDRDLTTYHERFRVEKLRRDHPVDGFVCGQPDLDRSQIRFAFGNQQSNASQTYLGLAGERVVGFYTLVVGQVAHSDAPDRVTKGLARHPVPIMLLARLAVAEGWQRQGLGAGLLKDAMRRTLLAADIGGIRAFVTHAKNDTAARFYAHFGFMHSPTDPRHLFLLIKDLRAVMSL